tara:strand:+ start:366 stop:1847 length:1482 start_codon:yes stop_codon:yes gene_type:complete
VNLIKNKLLSTSAINIFLILFVLIWSSKLFYLWSTDFGHYYIGANVINDDYRLYNELFEHKGPVYYFFIFLISKLIGYGYFQSYFVLCLTVLLYIFSLHKLCQFYQISKVYRSLVFLIFTSQLIRLNENVSLDIFKGALLILTFLYFIQYIKTNKNSSLLISFFFFSLAVLTRIDALFFIPLYFFALYETRNNKLLFTLKSTIKFSIIFSVLFLLFSIFYNFTISEFYILNIDFNSWRARQSLSIVSFHPILAYLYRPRLVEELLINGSIIAFLIVNFLPQHDKLQKDFKTSTLPNAVLILGLFSLIVSLSEKPYHLFIFYPYFTIYLVIKLSQLKKDVDIKLFLTTFSLITIFFVSPIVKTYLLDRSCFTDPFCNLSSLNNTKQIVDEIKNSGNQQILIISSFSWVYLFSETQPVISLDDNWLYMLKKPYTHSKGYLNSYEIINQLESNDYFYIYKSFYNQNFNNTNEFFESIWSKPYKIEELGNFLKITYK